jgi:hypothetical protein
LKDCKHCKSPIIGRSKQAKFCGNDCKVAYGNKHNPKRSSEKRREEAVLAKYGLTWDAYVELHKAAGGACEICRKPLSLSKTDGIETAFIDHDHATGKVRGVLCNPCNRGIGYLCDSRLHVASALTYLDKHAD